MVDCIFCQLRDNPKAIIAQNDSFYMVHDKFPVTKGHSLIISKRHFQTIFEMSSKEAADLPAILNQAKTILDEKFEPQGYNINNNNGSDAGQIILHCHIHVVPRYVQKENEHFHQKNGVYDKLAKPIEPQERP